MIGASAKCSHYPIRTTARQPRRVLDSTGVIRLIKYHQIRSKIAARMDDTHTNCTRGIRRHPLTKPSWHYLQNKCGLAFCSTLKGIAHVTTLVRLVKANSIQGNKIDDVPIVYTLAGNLKKTQGGWLAHARWRHEVAAVLCPVLHCAPR
jgi:hypothetical protein